MGCATISTKSTYREQLYYYSGQSIFRPIENQAPFSRSLHSVFQVFDQHQNNYATTGNYIKPNPSNLVQNSPNSQNCQSASSSKSFSQFQEDKLKKQQVQTTEASKISENKQKQYGETQQQEKRSNNLTIENPIQMLKSQALDNKFHPNDVHVQIEQAQKSKNQRQH